VRASLDQLSPPASELRLPALASTLGLARAYVHEAAVAFGFDDERSYEFAFAVNEAVTNAIRHGRPDAQGHIHLSVRADGDVLTAVVRDCGTFAGSAFGGSQTAESGRGFTLMGLMMDAVQLCVSPGSTTVRLSKALA
jgi:anti-sigma regulatory factor (Ser/Thr protein kinase)